MLKQEYKSLNISYRIFSYFEALVIEIHSCTGSAEVGGKHLEILGIPHRHSHIQLQEHSTFHGDVGSWFAKFISNQGTTTSNMPCFRMEESKLLCSGIRTDTRGLVLAIPIMLALQVPDSTDLLIWNFPKTLTPLTKTLAKKEGIRE